MACPAAAGRAACPAAAGRAACHASEGRVAVACPAYQVVERVAVADHQTGEGPTEGLAHGAAAQKAAWVRAATALLLAVPLVPARQAGKLPSTQ